MRWSYNKAYCVIFDMQISNASKLSTLNFCWKTIIDSLYFKDVAHNSFYCEILNCFHKVNIIIIYINFIHC